MLQQRLSLLLMLTLQVGLITCQPYDENKEVFFKYSGESEAYWLQEFFHDVEDEFYVDIGGYDPYQQTNTLNLYTKRWKGITIEASPERQARFRWQRPQDVSLNLAIGYSSKFVTFHDSPIGQVATLSDEVARVQDKAWNYSKNLNVPSLSLGELCQRYYHKKPMFMSLDTEGFGRKILESNDWNQAKCYPEVLFSEQNFLSYVSKLGPVDEYIKKYGYKLLDYRSDLNEIYIHQSVYQKYMKKRKQLGLNKSNFNQISLSRIQKLLKQQLKLNHTIYPHYQRQTDDVNIFVVKNSQLVQLQNIVKANNLITKTKKNKLVLLLNFNPKHHSILLSHRNYTINQIRLNQVKFINMTYYDQNQNASITVLMLDLNLKTNYPVNVISLNANTNKNQNSKQGLRLQEGLPHMGQADYQEIADKLSQNVVSGNREGFYSMIKMLILGVLLVFTCVFIIVIRRSLQRLTIAIQQVSNNQQFTQPKSQNL